MNNKTVSILSGAAGILLAGAIYTQVEKFPEYAIHASQYVKFLLLVLAILSGVLLVMSFFGREAGKPTWVKAPGHFFATAVLTILMVMSLKYVGFYVASAVYMLVLALLLGLRRPLLLIVCTALLLAIVYGVFVRFLSVPVPLGVFEEFTFSDIAGSLAKAKAAWALL
ncbi:MAG: tripartite tricarboxylate transporter TctB family protein [Pyramidobacter sp.]|nr:tripartite tricarboxylate transporter TctB family protein [Pyramidobacter sp.]MBR0107996.1 tripartite tricarboxylate transporter TctB family protein [Pyramidobacter sp.]